MTRNGMIYEPNNQTELTLEQLLLGTLLQRFEVASLHIKAGRRTDPTRRFVLLRIEFSGPTEKVKPSTAQTSSPAPTW